MPTQVGFGDGDNEGSAEILCEDALFEGKQTRLVLQKEKMNKMVRSSILKKKPNLTISVIKTLNIHGKITEEVTHIQVANSNGSSHRGLHWLNVLLPETLL